MIIYWINEDLKQIIFAEVPNFRKAKKTKENILTHVSAGENYVYID